MKLFAALLVAAAPPTPPLPTPLLPPMALTSVQPPSLAAPARGAVHFLLADDVHVSSLLPISVGSANFTLYEAAAESVVVADGRFFPDGPAVAAVALRINGAQIGTEQWIDWTPLNTTDGVQHSFSLVALAGPLPADTRHTLELVAWAVNGEPFVVGAMSGVGLLPLPPSGARAAASVLITDSSTFEFDAPPWDNRTLPYRMKLLSVINVTLPAAAEHGFPIVALASGRSFIAPGPNRMPQHAQGDAIWVVTLDGDQTIRNNETLHSDNDICFCAEAGNAPMMTHAFFPAASAAVAAHGAPEHTITLAASAEPWVSQIHIPGFPPGVNPVQYRVGRGTGLLALSGLPVMGRAVLTSAVDTPLDYVCVGTTKGWPSCPAAGPGTEYIFAAATVDLPAGHSGELVFVTKSIVQADGKDKGGIITLRLRIDGKSVGTAGVQQLTPPSCVSTRTIAASFVTSGAARLSEGNHTVEAVVQVTGDFEHICMVKDLPLVWFG
jgi:hypothetical protein